MYRSLENQPLDHPLESRLWVMGSLHSIETIRRPFLDSPYADMLRNNPPRYSQRYGWEDTEKFLEKLGPDVDPLQHGPYQARTVAIPMVDAQSDVDIEQNRLSYREAQHFVAYHVLHDDHEGVNGDVMFHDKTPASEREELDVWAQLITEVYGEAKSTGFISYAREFAGEQNHFLAKFWLVSERIGYMASGLQAYYLAEEDPELTPAERQTAYRMGRFVVLDHLGVVEENRDSVVLADNMLVDAAPTIQKISREVEHA